MRGLIGAAICLLAAAVPARAGVVVLAGVPFTASQLEAAIAARGGVLGDLEISRSGPERLELVMPAGRWQIEIGAASGEAAARVVALHVVELGLVPLAAAAPATSGAAATAPATAAAADLRASAAPPRPPYRYRLAALGVGSRGVRSDDFTSLGGAVELMHAGRWIAGGGIAWQRGLTIERPPAEPIGADLIRVRALGGVALGPIELVAGGFAGRMIVDGGTDVISAWATGLQAEARVVAPISAAWSIVFAAGAELFRHRIEIRFDGARLGATPRATLGGGIGLAWTGGPR